MSFKIIHIIPTLKKGGAERLVLDICHELVQQNHDVLLITFSDENAYQKVYPNIRVKVISASVSLSITKQNIYNTAELQKAIDDFAPDVIHSHLFEAEIVSRSCYYPTAKWFSHCHDNMVAFNNFSLQTISNKLAFTRFYEKKYLFNRYKKNGGNTFIAISNSTQKYFRDTASKFSVKLLPNAIDFNRFFIEKSMPTHNKIRFINVGSLVDNKNQTFLLDVATALKNKSFPFEGHFLGDGPNKKKLQDKINQLSLSENIVLHGNVDNVEKYLHASDIYLHSAKSEALGLTLLEAMAAGLPVITLDGKGNRDLIKEGKNGYMFFEEDAEAFAHKIIAVWRNKKRYYEQSLFAQEFARNYDIKPYITILLELYK